ncbi:MAG: hypothetical protein WAW62_02680 [Candidatus Saccharimonas aalborgensis]|jgi:hypothetical protein|uniref:hypothetical protein n=1 Tax=Candidatus Saccharimonas aalborgensis TaxID=1332188 RepID=UPI0003A18D77|nr:hypothetical protein [Candidatus Saccharimonas aalborgensis]MBP7775417.1 hypothetical protein [Candidatus Saccharimonas sp.]QQR51394.1 MAG: hypothetical protein IPF89_00975 [Candidatus Saccharibacteria bacterium]QQS68126.1 MAG: hypothetical protein IPP24_03895 [Candidatus Saccharibacteria bacterium]QQS70451.1 MAG: hypothetical protein IPP92_03910 [Candidatus Saccharibacteria bacterium]
MATKSTSKKSTPSRKVSAAKKAPQKKPVSRPVVSDKVDYYPNRMTVAISMLAGSLLVLLALIAVLT